MADRDVAIVGLAGVFPDALGVDAYWRNVVSGHDAIREGDGDLYAPGDRSSGRIYSRRGGVLPPWTFDAARFGIPPKAAAGGDADQWLALAVAEEALADAGLAPDSPARKRSGIVLGKGGYPSRGAVTPLWHGTVLEDLLEIVGQLRPDLGADGRNRVRDALRASLPAFDADTVSGIVPNIVASRIANRLDLMGPAYTIDAACASSLIAVDLACQYLAAGVCDTVLAGGVQLSLAVVIRQVFCQLGALSARDEIRPFDTDADGTLPGDGIGMVVLKRLEDARRDGDRIYAVVRGVGTSSDGRGLGVMAPRGEGEVLALQRAYAVAGVSPATVGLVEAHGTGTPVGDPTEVAALRAVFGERSGDAPRCALGSVKSMIGHLMPAAGVAGLIKAALALHHGTLPPTLKVRRPLPILTDSGSPFALVTRARPWLARDGHPRRAGVNAFGFGGINAHVVLEEAPVGTAFQSRLTQWESELVVVGASSRDALREAVAALVGSLADDAALAVVSRDSLVRHRAAPVRCAVVAESPADLKEKLARVADRLADPRCRAIRDPRGIFWFETPPVRSGKTALLFPGEGSQYAGMLAGLHPHFPEVRHAFDLANRAFERRLGGILPADFLYPDPLALEPERQRARDVLYSLTGAVTAVLAGDLALLRLFAATGLRPDGVLGHSTGEFVALVAGGAIPVASDDDEERFADALFDAFFQMPPADPDGDLLLAAIGADAARVRAEIASLGGDVVVAMENCSLQTVVSGVREKVEAVVSRFAKEGVLCDRLSFDRPYHTPGFDPFVGPIRDLLATWATSPGNVPIWTCATARPMPGGLTELRDVATDQWRLPVAFRPTIDAMYADGYRIFVEVGARGNLSAFGDDILRGKPHLCVPLDLENRSGTTQLCHALGLLIAAGHDLDTEILFRYRRTPAASVAGSAGVPIRMDAPRLLLPNDEALRLAPPPPSAATAPPSPPRPEDGGGPPDVLSAHFETMARFLAVEKEVMETYLGGAGQTSPPGAGPLLDQVVSLEPGVRAEARVRFDLERHTYLLDHEFGRRIAPSDPSLRGIPIVPMTVSLEVMAEVAAMLLPGAVLTGFRDIRGHRWIQVPPEAISVRVMAERAGDSVQVRIVPEGAEARPRPAYIEATVRFGERYPASPSYVPPTFADSRPSPWEPDDLYETLMFHGPVFRGMERIDAVGWEGLVARVRVPDRSGLLSGVTEPSLLSDPVALDVAGQLLGARFQAGTPDMVYFPARIAAIDLFAPPRPAGTRLDGAVWVRHQEAGFVVGDIVLAEAAEVVVSCTGWEDRAFPIAARATAFWLDPGQNLLAEAEPGPDGAGMVHRIDAGDLGSAFFATGWGVWVQTTLQCLLGAEERKAFDAAGFGAARRDEWLLGRIAAKDAIRVHVRERTGLRIAPAEIEVANDGAGRPRVRFLVPVGIDPPSVSIAHSGGRAVALVGDAGEEVGIDIEPAARAARLEPGFWTTVLDAEAMALVPAHDSDLWRMRLWCAREAASKALGRGLGTGLLGMRVRGLDPSTGVVVVDPGDGVTGLSVTTAVRDDWVTAVCRVRASGTERKDSR